eukprot:5413406-Alexandrium_andersonii.AAC.1
MASLDLSAPRQLLEPRRPRSTTSAWAEDGTGAPAQGEMAPPTSASVASALFSWLRARSTSASEGRSPAAF